MNASFLVTTSSIFLSFFLFLFSFILYFYIFPLCFFRSHVSFVPSFSSGIFLLFLLLFQSRTSSFFPFFLSLSSPPFPSFRLPVDVLMNRLFVGVLMNCLSVDVLMNCLSSRCSHESSVCRCAHEWAVCRCAHELSVKSVLS